MRDLSPLLGRSPRALKRFVNVYRRLKASLRRVDSTRLRGENDRRAVLFLLAIEAGLPRLASRMFTVLLDPEAPSAATRPASSKQREPAENEERTLPSWLRDVLGDPAGAGRSTNHDADAERLRRWLEVRGDWAFVDAQIARRWSPIVARFSFAAHDTGRS